MDIEVLKTVGQVAGIGGLALGVFLLLFREIIRKQIFPQLGKTHAYRLLRLISIFVFLIAVIGIGAWVWAEKQQPGPPPPRWAGAGLRMQATCVPATSRSKVVAGRRRQGIEVRAPVLAGALLAFLWCLFGLGPAVEAQPATVELGIANTGDLRARDIIIKKGLSEDEILTLMRAWRAEESASVQMAVELAGKLAVNQAAVTNFLRILDEQNVPDDQILIKLAEIASRHLELVDRLAVLEFGNRSGHCGSGRGSRRDRNRQLRSCRCAAGERGRGGLGGGQEG